MGIELSLVHLYTILQFGNQIKNAQLKSYSIHIHIYIISLAEGSI